jgi:hypothetical protein
MATPPDFVAGQVLTAAQMNKIGLWQVTAATFTTVGSVNVNNCFTSDFRNYKMIVRITASSTNQNVAFRMRASGTDSSASYYWSGLASLTASDTTTYFARSNNATSATVMITQATGTRSLVMDVMNPQLAENTYFHAMYTDFNAVSNYVCGGAHLAATAYDGFTLIAGAGGAATISGDYKVYGYND